MACRGSEPKYLIRSLEGKLRIGLAEQSVLIALAQASVQFLHQFQEESPTDIKNAFFHKGLDAALDNGVSMVKAVFRYFNSGHLFSEIPAYERIIPHLIDIKNGGIAVISSKVQMEPGCPIRPMLAHPTFAITEVLDRFESIPFTCEYKYDGERCQIHYSKSETAMQYYIFSRNLEDMSERYPDIISKLSKLTIDGAVELDSFVLDCEAVAWDPINKKILPFQVLSTRKRKVSFFSSC